MVKIISIILCTLAAISNLYSGDDHHPEPYIGSEAFQRLKSLDGTWEGTQKMEGEVHKVSVEYDLSSNGSALIEKLFCGTPHEMISIYHERDGKLQLTHYCALANQPNLVLTRSETNEIEFEFGGFNDIDITKDRHIHALKITFEGDNKMVQHWTSFKDGKVEGTTTVELTRVVN